MKTFIDYEDTEDPDGIIPPPPVTDEVIPVGPKADTLDVMKARYSHVLPYGTTLSSEWDEPWIARVSKAEAAKQHAICGAKRRGSEITPEDIADVNSIVMVCKRHAGYGTDHPGEGRCINHGGNSHLGTLKTGRFSLIRNNRLSGRVNEFFDSEELLDIRSAIGLVWAAMDAMLEDEEEISPQRAQEIGALATRVANMVKQHNDIQEKRRISIDVPEFMAWAEYFYELAVKHIELAGGDVAGFLRDAQQFYDRTVTIVVGPEAGRNRLGAGREVSAVSHEGVSRPSFEDA